MAAETRPIDSIKVGDRVRKDMGDLDALARSIEEHGPLIQPILIEEDGTLIAGGRRLAACKKLGREEIEVYVPAHQSEALQRVRKELDENSPELRKDFTPSEMVAAGHRLEELERPAAKARQAAAGPLEGRGRKTGSEDSPEPIEEGAKGSTRDKVGPALGVSGFTYGRAKKVVEAAATGDPIAEEAVAEMDRTGKVNTAYKKVFGSPSTGLETKTDAAGRKQPAVRFGKGDRWQEATEPLVRYLRGQRNRNFDFSHLNWKEAKKRVERIDTLIVDLQAARADLEPRRHKAKLTFDGRGV